MDLGVQNKVFMVAGATSSGLGYAIAKKFAVVAVVEGASVSITSRSRERVAKAATSVSEEAVVEIRGYVFDARDTDSIMQWIEDTQSDLAVLMNWLSMLEALRQTSLGSSMIKSGRLLLS